MANVIQTNTASMVAAKFYSLAESSAGTAAERISSGLRVNSAMDDASGLALLNGLTKTSAVMDQIIQNANDGISLVHVAEGALDEVEKMIVRIRELSIQAASSTMTAEDRQTLKNEADQLIFEIDRIQANTSFNGMALLDGTFTGQKIHVTQSGVANDVDITIENTNAETLFDDVEQFVNGDFSSTTATAMVDSDGLAYDSIDGWRIYKTKVDFGVSQIGGFDTPTDAEVSYKDPATFNAGQYGDGYELNPDGSVNPDALSQVTAATTTYSINDSGLKLTSNSFSATQGYAVVHGPYLISEDYIQISEGSTISFDWSAVSGGDDFAVYGYLLKDDGTRIELLDRVGATGSGTYSSTLGAGETGNYKFVFVSGSFDASGGRYMGASFIVDDVAVTKPANQSTIIDYADRDAIEDTLARIDGAAQRLSDRRLNLGSVASRLERVVSNAMMEHEQHMSTRSNGYDADYAKEVAQLTKDQLLMKAVSSMLAQANISPKLAAMLVKK